MPKVTKRTPAHSKFFAESVRDFTWWPGNSGCENNTARRWRSPTRYDLQDLFYALLRLQFDEVATEERAPDYAERVLARTSYLLDWERTVVVVKHLGQGLRYERPCRAGPVGCCPLRYTTERRYPVVFYL